MLVLNGKIQEIACQQILHEDSSVFSVQWMDLDEATGEMITPDLMFERYLAAVSRCTCGLVKATLSSAGVDFSLRWKFLPALISFSFPEKYRDDGDARISLRINGGLLVQKGEHARGELVFVTSRLDDGGKRVALRLSDYCPFILGRPGSPLFRRWLYLLTQSAIHRIVTVRFLAMLYRETAGPSACFRNVRRDVR